MTTEDASPLLTWTDDGEPRSGRFGDVYFSRDDGLAESRAVFLGGCGLPDAWAGRRCFTVAELGFGTGLNIVALLDLWRRERPPGGRLHIVSVEGFPLTADEARRALAAWPDLAAVSQALLDVWPAGTPGFHRIDLPLFDAVIDLAVGDAAWALEQWGGAADAWFLDGFSPALNPAMWSPQVLDLIAARSAPGARLATFTVAGAVRRGLAERGFKVEKQPGHGRKRERLEARFVGQSVGAPTPRVAVIGAGVAGAAMARALTALGAAPIVYEVDRPGAGASGFPSGLVTPRLDAGDRDIAALHAQALARARDLYDTTPDAVVGRGVLQLIHAERDAGRFAKIAAQPDWAPGAMAVVDATAASDWLGEPVEAGGLMMRDARVVRPAAILQAWLAGVELRQAAVSRLARDGETWRLFDAEDALLDQVDAVVLAAGWGAAALLEGRIALTPVRGQADWVEDIAGPAAAWGGYAAPTASGVLFGATHRRGDIDLTPRDAESETNRATLAGRLPQLAARVGQAEGRRRVAIRATTADRLPVAGTLEAGLYMLGGLGSRGFCVAPLLAEHLAALILQRPSPLPSALARRVEPGREAIRPKPLAEQPGRAED